MRNIFAALASLFLALPLHANIVEPPSDPSESVFSASGYMYIAGSINYAGQHSNPVDPVIGNRFINRLTDSCTVYITFTEVGVLTDEGLPTEMLIGVEISPLCTTRPCSVHPDDDRQSISDHLMTYFEAIDGKTVSLTNPVNPLIHTSVPDIFRIYYTYRAEDNGGNINITYTDGDCDVRDKDVGLNLILAVRVGYDPFSATVITGADHEISTTITAQEITPEDVVTPLYEESSFEGTLGEFMDQVAQSFESKQPFVFSVPLPFEGSQPLEVDTNIPSYLDTPLQIVRSIIGVAVTLLVIRSIVNDLKNF